MMQTSDNNRLNKSMHRKVQVSTTLSRKYTKRPTGETKNASTAQRSPQIHRINSAAPMSRTTRRQSQANNIYQRRQPRKIIPITDSQSMQSSTDNKAMDQITSIHQSPANAIDAQAVQIASMNYATQQVLSDNQTGLQPDSAQQVTLAAQHQQAQTYHQEQATPVAHPLQSFANKKMKARAKRSQGDQAPKITAKELKEHAIQKALASASTIKTSSKNSNLLKSRQKSDEESMTGSRVQFGVWRILLALSCAAIAVFAIVYCVNLSMPDISLRVAAMQTGMDPTYPNYVPRDYNITSITSENGKVTMDFSNKATGDAFSLTEEKSSWDTSALASNYVKSEYGENYSVVREQGLTIYISGSDAAWVNKGMVYKIKTTSGTLTNKQIRSIAVSL